MRGGGLWNKDAVLWLIDQPAVAGTLYRGHHRRREHQDAADRLALPVEPIIDPATYALAQELRLRREPSRTAGRAAARPHLLSGLLRCGQCGASYQLETSGKRVDGAQYRYCYYNCRRANRAGVEACPGFRIDTATLDEAVMSALADAVCSEPRATRLAVTLHADPDRVRQAWRALVTAAPAIGRTYALHLVDGVVVHEDRIVITPRGCGRIDGAEREETAAD